MADRIGTGRGQRAGEHRGTQQRRDRERATVRHGQDNWMGEECHVGVLIGWSDLAVSPSVRYEPDLPDTTVDIESAIVSRRKLLGADAVRARHNPVRRPVHCRHRPGRAAVALPRPPKGSPLDVRRITASGNRHAQRVPPWRLARGRPPRRETIEQRVHRRRSRRRRSPAGLTRARNASRFCA